MNLRITPRLLVAYALLGGGGCGSNPADTNAAGGAGSCQPGLDYPCVCGDGVSRGTGVCAPDGNALGVCQCDGGLGSTANASNGLAGASALPCEVASILSEHCSLCHGATPQFTAPMSLVTWEHLTTGTPSNLAVPVQQTVLARVKDELQPMPPVPNPRLSAEEIGVLEAWVAAGAPKGTGASCDPATMAMAGSGGVSATAGTGATTDAGAVDPTEECYEFHAHSGDKVTEYTVPTTPDLYHCFYFAPPWGNTQVQAIRTENITDNSMVLHHWILYSSAGAVTDGSHSDCPTGSHAGGQYLVGWAPGAPPMEMPADVGLAMPGAGYNLEIHYNATTAGQTDGSGVRLCVTRTPRANTAAVHPLGQEPFTVTGAGSTTGTCKPRGPFPITVMSSGPHMHLKGTRMTTVVKRANGTVETLIDQPFNFQNQIAYDTPMVLYEGDTLETTCMFNGSASFGTGTNQEMCYNFVTAYPAGALAGASGYTGISGNGNTCIKTSFGF